MVLSGLTGITIVAMIDIHSHLLYGVDDGAQTIIDSEKMLKQAAAQEITGMILTPHYRKGVFKYPKEIIQERYAELKDIAKDFGITLYLGCEYYADSRITENIASGRCLTMGGSEYLLVEFDYKADYHFIRSVLENCILSGIYPIIAHAERYETFIKDIKLLADFRQMGCLIQLNADSILGLDGRAVKRLCKKILKNELADIVASDCHDTEARGNHVADCYTYIGKKFGTDVARKLLIKNPRKIIEAADIS